MKQDSSTHFQDSPNKEGTAGNTPSQGQQKEGSNPQQMPGIDQYSQEQQAGRKEKEEDQADTIGNP